MLLEDTIQRDSRSPLASVYQGRTARKHLLVSAWTPTASDGRMMRAAPGLALWGHQGSPEGQEP